METVPPITAHKCRPYAAWTVNAAGVVPAEGAPTLSHAGGLFVAASTVKATPGAGEVTAAVCAGPTVYEPL